MKEILLYGSMYSYSAADFIEALEANKNSDIVVRMNTDGGNPEDMYGMVAKMKECKVKLIKVDGRAKSSGFFACCMAKKVSCLNVSGFMAHRAAYGSWIESNPSEFTEARKESLRKINADLRAAMESKIDVARFERMKGVTMDRIFDIEQPVIDIELTASEAREIGLVDEIVDITAPLATQINSYCSQLGLAALYTGAVAEVKPVSQPLTPTPRKAMTIEELRANHPELFRTVSENAVKAERDRVGAFMVFLSVDAEAVKKGIASGEAMTQTQQAELLLKGVQANALGSLPTEPAKPAAPGAADSDKTPEQIAAEKKVADFLAEAKAKAGITGKADDNKLVNIVE